MTKSKKVVYQDDEYVIFEDGSGGAIMSDEEIEDAEKFDEWFNSLTKEEQDAYIQNLKGTRHQGHDGVLPAECRSLPRIKGCRKRCTAVSSSRRRPRRCSILDRGNDYRLR